MSLPADGNGHLQPAPALQSMPESGFLWVTRKEVPADQRTALIRKGNQLFTDQKYGLAERIFVTVHYSDGLVRLGDLYRDAGRPLDALRMYWLAPDETRKELVVAQLAAVVSKWMRE